MQEIGLTWWGAARCALQRYTFSRNLNMNLLFHMIVTFVTNSVMIVTDNRLPCA